MINKILRLNNVATAVAIYVKIAMFVVSVEVIIYLLLYNLHDCTFKRKKLTYRFYAGL